LTRVVCNGDTGVYDLQDTMDALQTEFADLYDDASAGKQDPILDHLRRSLITAVDSDSIGYNASYLNRVNEQAVEEATRQSEAVLAAGNDNQPANPQVAGAGGTEEGYSMGLRRKVINTLCKVEKKLDSTITSSLPIPRTRARLLTTKEGQRPTNPDKVTELAKMIVSNPHTSPLQMQMVVLDTHVTPDKALMDYDAALQKSGSHCDLPPLYGVSGGGHYFLAVGEAIKVKPQLASSSKAQFHQCELYAFGWLQVLEDYFLQAEAKDEAQTKVLPGRDNLRIRCFQNFELAEEAMGKLLPQELWAAVSSAERTVIPSVADAINILVREHNEVASLADESTLDQKLTWLRERCQELQLAESAAYRNCAGVPEGEKGSMELKLGVKTKALVPYLRVALSPPESYGLLMQILKLHREFGLKGQQKPKRTAAKPKALYPRKLFPLWEENVSESGRVAILTKLVNGDISLNDLVTLKNGHVIRVSLWEVLLLQIAWDANTNVRLKDVPQTIEECTTCFKHQVADVVLNLLVDGCMPVTFVTSRVHVSKYRLHTCALEARARCVLFL
jgi:hypothetical protein